MSIKAQEKETILRKDTHILLGISKNKLSEIIRNHKYLNFPAQVNKGLIHQRFYKDDVLKWMDETDYHNIKWTQNSKIPDELKPVSFDNKLAVKFLSSSFILPSNFTGY